MKNCPCAKTEPTTSPGHYSPGLVPLSENHKKGGPTPPASRTTGMNHSMDNEIPVVSTPSVLKGVFYKDANGHLCSEDGGSVAEALTPSIGRKVMVTVHHDPPSPPTDEWGGGSCMWGPTGSCPVGHHERPGWLHHVFAQGVLSKDPWAVGGTPLRVDFLEGHHSMLVIVEMFDADAFEGSDNIGDLLSRATNMSSMLQTLSEKLKEEM